MVGGDVNFAAALPLAQAGQSGVLTWHGRWRVATRLSCSGAAASPALMRGEGEPGKAYALPVHRGGSVADRPDRHSAPQKEGSLFAHNDPVEPFEP